MKPTLEQIKILYIRRVLKENNMNRKRSSIELDVSERTLRAYIDVLKIEFPYENFDSTNTSSIRRREFINESDPMIIDCMVSNKERLKYLDEFLNRDMY